MISVLLYGRNDGYGYNLAKRTAIGLNCLAEVLRDRDDEIHFVDCHTADSFCTLPESIADTLTPRCKQMLRVWRFRPSHYAAYRRDTKLPLLESLSRNIALRRSNPRNRWVLSSNPDMIFAPKHRFQNLSKIAARLGDGFYELPRFELPECVWETFDRLDPGSAIKAAARAGDRFRLNYVVNSSPFARFSGLGDFQLALRSQMFEIGGFDESMIYGWHVDTNLAKRLWLLNGETRSLDQEIAGYHCAHLRSAMTIHTSESTQNSYADFVDGVTVPHLRRQPDWGLPEVKFEEIRLDQARPVLLDQIFDQPAHALNGQTLEMGFNTGQHWHDAGTALSHLANELHQLPRDLRAGYVGVSEPLIEGMQKVLKRMGFVHDLAVARNGEGLSRLVRECDVIVLDADLEPVSGGMKTKHKKLTTLQPDHDQGAAVRAHLEIIRGWFTAAVEVLEGDKTAASAKRFMLRGLWLSPLQPWVKQYFTLTSAPPAVGFVPARWRSS